MVINDKLKFVFLHVPKTGGTSISSVLQKLEGSRPVDDKVTKHLTAEQIPETKDYFTFGFVRNPWTRMVSLYHFLNGPSQKFGSFRLFMLEISESADWVDRLHSMRPQKEFFPKDRTPEFVGSFEYLARDYHRILDRLGVPFVELPHLNGAPDETDYRDMYELDDQNLVAVLFQEDIEYFGYAFENPYPAEPRNL